jgi:hypothetical protein
MKGMLCIVLVLLAALGNAQIVEWIHRYDGPDNQPDIPYDIAVDSSGNVYVCGFGWLSGTHEDYLTIKYYSNGDTAWVRYYDGGQQFYDYGRAVAVDDSGNVFVTGSSMESGNQFGIATIKYNSAGVEQWIARYEGPGNDDDEAYDIALDNNGYIYVCGYTRSAATYTDYVTIKYDGNGDTVWTSIYNGPFSGLDRACALVLDDSGNVYVTGSGNSVTYDPDYYTIKIDAAGDTQWVVAYDGTADYGTDEAVDIAVGGGYIYVTGTSEGLGSGDDYVTVKYSPAGDTLWEMRYDGIGNWDDAAHALVTDSIGNVFVTGESQGATTMRDYATIKYNFSGNIDWVSRYDGPDSDNDEAIDIVLDNYGNVFVTGQSYATQPYTPEYDFLTVEYNSLGVEQWTHRYNGPGDTQDHPYAITADDAGNVYMTGSSIGNTGYEDVVTVKYGVTGITEDAGYKIDAARYNLTVSPNPFHDITQIRFTMHDSRYMIQEPEINIYDVGGRLVKSFNPESCILDHVSTISWDGTDQANRQLSSGVYFLRLDAGDHQETRQILLIK